MASVSDLSLKYHLFLKTYRFRRLDPVPWAPPAKPLEDCRVALVTTAGFHLPGTPPFDEQKPGGDTSYRLLPVRGSDGAPADHLRDLLVSHRSTSFDRSGIEADYNLALPVARFVELEAERRIGALHPEALSFMGSITAPGRLVKESAPGAAEHLRSAGVDAAFLCPV